MSHECENFTDTGCRQCMKEMAAAIAAKPPPEEKPDDVVERCAKALREAMLRRLPWEALTEHDRGLWGLYVRAVLQAAGVERLREQASSLDAVAQVLHPHWKGEDGHTYIPEQLPGMVSRLREERDRARARLQSLLRDEESTHERAEAAETALAEAKSRIADLGHVVERAVAMRSQYLRRWTNSPSMLCDPSVPPASVQDFDDAMKALDAAQPKDSGEPGRTPSPGPHREDGYAELSGSSSLSRDVATIALILRQGYCESDDAKLDAIIERNER